MYEYQKDQCTTVRIDDTTKNEEKRCNRTTLPKIPGMPTMQKDQVYSIAQRGDVLQRRVLQ